MGRGRWGLWWETGSITILKDRISVRIDVAWEMFYIVINKNDSTVEVILKIKSMTVSERMVEGNRIGDGAKKVQLHFFKTE